MVSGIAGLAGCVSSDLRKAEICLAQGDAERSFDLFSSVLDRDPTQTRGLRGVGLSLLLLATDKADDGEDRASDWGKAVRALGRADTSGDSTVREALLEARVRWARSLASQGDTLRSEEILEELVVAHPRRTGPRKSLAVLLAHTGRNDRAEELFLRNAALDSSDVDTWFNLGLLAWNQGRHREAAEHFLRAQRLAPTDPEILWWASKVASEVER